MKGQWICPLCDLVISEREDGPEPSPLVSWCAEQDKAMEPLWVEMNGK